MATQATSATNGIPKLGYSFREAAQASSLSRSMLYQLLADGKLRTVQLGRRRIIPADELARLLGARAA